MMCNYYVMSIVAGKNILNTTRGLAAYLFHRLEDINDVSKLISESKDINECTESIYLSTIYFKKYTFSIRSIVDMYIVSNGMLALIEEFKIKIVKKYNLIIVNSSKSEEMLTGQYCLIKFEEVEFIEVLDLEKSLFEQEYPNTIDEIKRLELLEKVDLDFFIISELRMDLKTPVCSDKFKKRYELMNLAGVEFYDINTASWLNGSRAEIEYIMKKTGKVIPFVNPI